MPTDLYPEHEKLAERRDERDFLTAVWDWLAQNRLKVCERKPLLREQIIACDKCDATGRELKDLTKRQRQIIRHFQFLEGGARSVWDDKKREERKKLLGDLAEYVEALPTCWNCAGKGKTKVWVEVEGKKEWTPAYSDPHKFIAAYLEIDFEKFQAEKERMFEELRNGTIPKPPRDVSDDDEDVVSTVEEST
jgi:hypothetical protein